MKTKFGLNDEVLLKGVVKKIYSDSLINPTTSSNACNCGNMQSSSTNATEEEATNSELIQYTIDLVGMSKTYTIVATEDQIVVTEEAEPDEEVTDTPTTDEVNAEDTEPSED